MVKAPVATVFASNTEDSAPVAKLEKGVVAFLYDIAAHWCRIAVKDGFNIYSGWVKRDAIWGVLPTE